MKLTGKHLKYYFSEINFLSDFTIIFIYQVYIFKYLIGFPNIYQHIHLLCFNQQFLNLFILFSSPSDQQKNERCFLSLPTRSIKNYKDFMTYRSEFLLKRSCLEFLGGPVAETPLSQYREPGFDPWSRTQIPHASTKDPACSNED